MRSRFLRLGVFAILVLAAAGLCAQDFDEWVLFSPPKGRFSVRLPASVAGRPGWSGISRPRPTTVPRSG
ncbi:MAG: hypothetical protein M3S32_09815 [Acidobacteriota bacterium]|nr:hypothetical protein [Acidobacteriota bacterium]